MRRGSRSSGTSCSSRYAHARSAIAPCCRRCPTSCSGSPATGGTSPTTRRTSATSSNDEVVGKLLWDRLPHGPGRPRARRRDERRSPGDPGVIEYHLDFEDGSRRHYEGRFAASGDDEFLMIVREITERKQQQEELEASRQRIVAAGDAARRKLERNLHDGAQQRLVSLSLSLRLAQNQVAKSPARAEELLEASREELMQALEELRELARGIHPGSPHRPRARGGPRVARRPRGPPGRDRLRPGRRAAASRRGGRLLRRVGGARERHQVRQEPPRSRSAVGQVERLCARRGRGRRRRGSGSRARLGSAAACPTASRR